MTTTTISKPFDLVSLLEEVKNRDMSQLNLISDEQYEIGLNRIEKDIEKGNNYDGNFALIKCEAIKNTGNG